MTGLTPTNSRTPSDKIRIFVSYDRAHDGDLHDRLAEQATMSASGFEITARSGTDRREATLRREIRKADEIIVICGEHTDASDWVGEELRIAQEEERPYLLLWGRREAMCTKPAAAVRDDSMYGWTREILRSQIVNTLRVAETSQRMTERSRTKPPRAKS